MDIPIYWSGHGEPNDYSDIPSPLATHSPLRRLTYSADRPRPCSRFPWAWFSHASGGRTGGWTGANPIQVGVRSDASGTDWPRFLGPTGDSKSPETGILTHWPPDGPPVVWHRQLGTSYGIGSVAGGRFFQFDRHGDQARLTCLDARTGKLLWKIEYPTDYEDRVGYNNGPRCSPVIDDGRVYLFGAEGMLHCVGADDGKPLWKVDTAKRFGVVQNFFGVGSTPVVDGDLLMVMVGGSPPESQGAGRFDMDRVRGNGSGDRGLRQADRRGPVHDRRRVGQLRHAAAGHASTAAAGASPSPAAGWSASSRGPGKVDFHYPWRARLHDSVNASTPVVVGDEVFISECYGPGSSLLRVRPGGYDVVWRDPPGREQGHADAIGTRRSTTRAISTAPAAGTRATPSCGASSGRPAR